MFYNINLGNTSNTYRHLAFSQSPFMPQLSFRVTNHLATEPVSNTLVLLGVLVKYTSISYISNILLSTLPAFLSTKHLGQLRLSDRSPHNRSTQSRAWVQSGASSLVQQLLCRFTKYPFQPLPFLKLSGFTNHQLLMLLLDFYFRSVKHRESLKDHCIYP